jgi:hypothetical protein
MRVRHEGDTHWFLVNINTTQRIDPTAKQFKKRPPYHRAKGSGFLTKKPSKRARDMMKRMVWQ